MSKKSKKSVMPVNPIVEAMEKDLGKEVIGSMTQEEFTNEYNRRWDELVYGPSSYKKFPLTFELVPKSSAHKNLFNYLRKEDWDRIRKQTYAAYGDRCGICRAEGSLDCHEIWEYDDEKHIQKLAGLIALCKLCHQVKHIGYTESMAKEGKADYEKAVEHFMKVNNCDRATFDRCRVGASVIWHERSRHEWQVDFGEYTKLTEKR